MYKITHTEGPWTVDPSYQRAHMGGERIFKVVKANNYGGLIADVSSWWVDPETAQANARLIASAPALLAALDTIANGLEYYLDDGSNISKTVLPLEAVEIARAAIALAKGESR